MAKLDIHLPVRPEWLALHSEPVLEPDLAIVDLNLPKHGGLEIIQQMRANPTFAEVPVIILSSSTSMRDRSKMETFRIKRYIVKPADLAEFMKIGWQIRELLMESKTRGQSSGA